MLVTQIIVLNLS